MKLMVPVSGITHDVGSVVVTTSRGHSYEISETHGRLNVHATNVLTDNESKWPLEIIVVTVDQKNVHLSQTLRSAKVLP